MASMNIRGINRVSTVFLVFLIFLYISSMNPCAYYDRLAILTEQDMSKDFVVSQDGFSVGEKIILEHGTKTYLGSNIWSYSTFLGESNTWNGSHYASYLYDELTHSVNFADHRLSLYDWYAVFENMTDILIDDMRFIVQYWQTQAGGRWAELDLYAHSFLTAIEENNMLRFGQRFTDYGSTLDIWYIITNNDNIKILLNFTAEIERLYRFQWQLTGIDGQPQLSNKSISFDDVNIIWNDTELNASYEWTVDTKKLDISFDGVTIGAGETYTLDPSVNPVLGADGDDDWWRVDSTTWIRYHTTTGTTTQVLFNTAAWRYLAQCRFVLDIDDGVIIDTADLSGFKLDDPVASRDVYICRIDELDVGSLESDTVFPDDTNATLTVNGFTTTGTDNEWFEADVVDLVQDMVDEVGWTSGYHIAFRLYYPSHLGSQALLIEDYQHAQSEVPFLNVTYHVSGGPETINVYEIIELSDSIDTAETLVLLSNEIIELADSLAVAMTSVLSIMEIISIAGIVTVRQTLAISINELIAFSGSVFTDVIAEGQYSIIINEIINLQGTVSTILNTVISINENIGLFDSITALVNPTITIVINVVIPIGESITVIGGLEGINIFYDLFLSSNMWGYIGPLALAIGGYYIAKKSRSLGVLWFIVDCLFISQYFELIEANPNYWWQIIILMMGCILCLIPALMDRN